MVTIYGNNSGVNLLTILIIQGGMYLFIRVDITWESWIQNGHTLVEINNNSFPCKTKWIYFPLLERLPRNLSSMIPLVVCLVLGNNSLWARISTNAQNISWWNMSTVVEFRSPQQSPWVLFSRQSRTQLVVGKLIPVWKCRRLKLSEWHYMWFFTPLNC